MLLTMLFVFCLFYKTVVSCITKCVTEPPKKKMMTKKKWQEYTKKLYKKDRHDPDNHNGVITHLEPDILECEVKWALGSITMNKASRCDGIPVELFQILKMMLRKCYTQ